VTYPTNANRHIILNVSLLVVVASFLAYSIYWLVNGIIWGYTITQMLLHINKIFILSSMGPAELMALFIQEGCSVVGSFVLLLCGAFAFQSAVYYVRSNPNFLRKVRWALVLLAVFSLLLVPASLHHLLGVVFGWSMVDIYVGLSYLVQALLIVPPLLILSIKLRNPENKASINKWVVVAAPAFVFALYFKYLFLWADTLSPMGPKTASASTLVGETNSLVTLLVAGAVTTIACYTLSKGKRVWKPLVGTALILVGVFFIIFSIVAIFVPIYASFWYLTDFWILTLPILGMGVLAFLCTGKVKEYQLVKGV